MPCRGGWLWCIPGALGFSTTGGLAGVPPLAVGAETRGSAYNVGIVDVGLAPANRRLASDNEEWVTSVHAKRAWPPRASPRFPLHILNQASHQAAAPWADPLSSAVRLHFVSPATFVGTPWAKSYTWGRAPSLRMLKEEAGVSA